jgi:hypothetical protein
VERSPHPRPLPTPQGLGGFRGGQGRDTRPRKLRCIDGVGRRDAPTGPLPLLRCELRALHVLRALDEGTFPYPGRRVPARWTGGEPSPRFPPGRGSIFLPSHRGGRGDVHRGGSDADVGRTPGRPDGAFRRGPGASGTPSPAPLLSQVLGVSTRSRVRRTGNGADEVDLDRSGPPPEAFIGPPGASDPPSRGRARGWGTSAEATAGPPGRSATDDRRRTARSPVPRNG